MCVCVFAQKVEIWNAFVSNQVSETVRKEFENCILRQSMLCAFLSVFLSVLDLRE
jgi:hypothetical protein